MILVDSSVWIAFFNGQDIPQAEMLDRLLGLEPILLGDLILAEVLQGFRHDRDFRSARDHLLRLPFAAMGGQKIALQSAANFRVLRRRGVTVRKTIDVFIATFCIENAHMLLHCDRDFDVMQAHLGLGVLPADLV